jgi:pilus assembly protein Flp/PilA
VGNLFRRVVITVVFSSSQEGQGLVEYALILVLVAIAVIAIMILVGPAVGNVFSNIVAAI